MRSNRPIRVLLVEDSDDDAFLIERQMRRYGFEPRVERVETVTALDAALDCGAWDLLILDYNLPQLNPRQVLALLKERGLDLPTIVVSGAVGEEKAVEAMREGAADFIRKDNWARLGPAIERELQEADVRRERRRIEEERARLLSELDAERNWLRAVIDNSPVGIIRVEDGAGRQVIANRRAEELFGHPLSAEGGIAEYVGQIYRPDGTPLHQEELAVWRALQGQTVTSEEEILRQPDGREVYVLVSSVPLRTGESVIGAVVAYEDVTRLRELERLRDEWNSIIAHDLRQPISVISGYAGMLRRSFATSLGERGQQIVEQILGASRHLDRMVSDLLDISRIDARRLQLETETIDLVQLVRSVVDRSSTAGTDRPIRVEGSSVPPITADPARIAQVLGNLLTNAVKYGAPGTDILVVVAAHEGVAEIAVTNRGAGIPPDELSRLFTRFYRTDRARSERIEGLGLGLYICKGLVEAHGGEILVESTPGETTTFRVRLPLVTEASSL